MIKIFDSTDTSFNTNGNIVIEPLKLNEVKKKSLNGWYIEVEIPIKYKDYIEQDKLCVVKTKSKLRPQAFRISNVEYSQRKITFTAEHVMFDARNYFLLDVRPTNLNGLNTLKYINERTDKTSPFNIMASDIAHLDTCYFIRKNLLEAWTIIEERYNGVFDADNFDISFNSTIGVDRGETIIYGKNLQNIKVFEDWSNVCTRIYPVGKDGLMLENKFIDSEIQYERPYTKTISFETELEENNQTEENLLIELKENASDYLKNNQIPLVSYEINSDINQLMEIGDKIHVKHPIVNILTEVLEYEYNGIAKKVKKIVFGNYTRDVKTKFDNIKNSIENIKTEVSNQTQLINKQTDLINSLNKNGYVYIDDNEILILDALPISSAKNVWRFGLGGIGFSSNGYKGPFNTAMTSDGSINADFITTGTLSADRIEGYSQLVLSVSQMNEKVNTLEMTSESTKSRISSVETDLNTTKTNLSNLSDKVDTLSDNIDGVSADFDDFKDNEYIQSIDNLQKQIDGAIQFWNGAEIPTLENYPANEWTTENDKINHQADIYTVVQDVEGEMKQGKSYRFDKVGGVWQWIELTDNELSAVQAIAQEALDKVKANATEIGTIKTNVSELQQTDEQIKASVESIDKQIIPTATATGSNIYVEDASDDPLIHLEIEGKSTQKTRSGKNLLKDDFQQDRENNGIKFTYNSDGSYIIDGTASGGNGALYLSKTDFTLPAGTYYVIPSTNIQLVFYDGIGYYDYFANEQFTLNEDTTFKLIYFQVPNGRTVTNEIVYPMISTTPITVDDFEQYGISPSSKYPSKIKSLGYKNLLNNIMQSQTLNEVQFTVNDDKSITIVGTATDRTEPRIWNNSTGNLILEAGKKYYNSTGEILYFYANGYYSIADGGYIQPTTDLTVQYVYIRVESGTIINKTIYPSVTKDESHFFIPYGKYGIEVETIGKNLLNVPKEYILIGNQTINTILEAGTYTVSSKSIETTGNYAQISFYFEDTSLSSYYVQLSPSKLSYTFTLNSRVTSIRIYSDDSYTSSQTTTTTFRELMISRTGGEYQSYQKNISLLVLNEPPRSLPSGVKDKVYIKNNKLYVDRYVGSIILDGSEDWKDNWQNSSTADYIQFYLPSSIFNDNYLEYTPSNPNALCNYFELYGTVWGLTKELLALNIHKTYSLQVKMLLADMPDLTTFKEWLSTHNIQIDYELSTPIIEEIGEITMPSTFKGINHITTTDDLEPTINIEYVRDTTLSNYVESQINNVVEIQQRKNAELALTDEEIKASVSEVSTISSNNYQELSTKFNNYTPTSKTTELEKSVTNIQTNTYTKTEINTKLTDGSVTKVHTVSGTFDEDGMHYEKTNAPTSTTINEVGVGTKKTNSSEYVLFAGYVDENNTQYEKYKGQTIVASENMLVSKYLVVGSNSRLENYGNGTGIFML